MRTFNLGNWYEENGCICKNCLAPLDVSSVNDFGIVRCDYCGCGWKIGSFVTSYQDDSDYPFRWQTFGGESGILYPSASRIAYYNE